MKIAIFVTIKDRAPTSDNREKTNVSDERVGDTRVFGRLCIVDELELTQQLCVRRCELLEIAEESLHAVDRKHLGPAAALLDETVDQMAEQRDVPKADTFAI